MKKYLPVVFHPNGITSYISQIPAEFTKLEECLDQNIWTLFHIYLRLDHQGPADFGELITSQIHFDQKLCLLSSLIERVFGEKSDNAEKILAFCKRAAFLQEKKEQFLHSPWGLGEDDCLYVGKHPDAPRLDRQGDQWQKIEAKDLSLFLREIQKLCADMVVAGLFLDGMEKKLDYSPHPDHKEKRPLDRRIAPSFGKNRTPFQAEKKPFI